MAKSPTPFTKAIRNNLLAGLLVMAPIGVTIYVVNWLFESVDAILGPHLSALLVRTFPNIFGGRIPGLGIFATCVLLLFTGSVTRSYLGSRVLRSWERFIERVPILGTVNMAVKQVLRAIAASDKQGFSRVVFVPFPDETSYVIGFVTGSMEVAPGDVRRNVFIPTAPNPTTGILALMRQDLLVDSDLSVEEAMKLVVSAGLVERFEGTEPSVPAVEPSQRLPSTTKMKLP